MRHAAILENGITFLTPFDIWRIRAARRSGSSYVPVFANYPQEKTQALMLIGHGRGSSAILASVLAEMLQTMMRAGRVPRARRV